MKTDATIGTVLVNRHDQIISKLHKNDLRVDGVRDDQSVSIGRVLGNSFGKVADDGCVGVEQVVTGHAGLSGHTSRDNDNLGALQSLSELVLGVTNNLGQSVRLAN